MYISFKSNFFPQLLFVSASLRIMNALLQKKTLWQNGINILFSQTSFTWTVNLYWFSKNFKYILSFVGFKTLGTTTYDKQNYSFRRLKLLMVKNKIILTLLVFPLTFLVDFCSLSPLGEGNNGIYTPIYFFLL